MMGVKRRIHVVDIFLNDDAISRLVGGIFCRGLTESELIEHPRFERDNWLASACSERHLLEYYRSVPVPRRDWAGVLGAVRIPPRDDAEPLVLRALKSRLVSLFPAS